MASRPEIAQPYDRTTVMLHWVTAALALVLWTIGQTADWLPRGPGRSAYWSTHVVLGVCLAAVLLWRIAWRGGPGRILPPADRGALHVLAKTTHYLLYLLLVTVVTLGMANAFNRGWSVYGLFSLPQLGDPDWKRPITQWHELAANAVLALALFHASAALVHQYVWRDGLLRRMVPGASRGRAPAALPAGER